MFSRHLTCALSAFAAFFLVASANAEPIEDHQPHIEASLGARVSGVSGAGFDPFADTDALAQVSLGLGGTLFAEGRFSLAAYGFWDYGARSSQVRGEATALTVQRLSIGPEARYHLLPRLYLFAHVLPAFAHSDATLDDGVAEVGREAKHWAYGVDGGAGAAFEMYRRPGQRIRPALWLIAEGGYGYLGSTRLLLKTKEGSAAPERAAPVDLGALSLQGPYARLSVALGF
ncbi:MAG: hypothetical protein ABJB12_07085 [Pseudomonadota bacterium]